MKFTLVQKVKDLLYPTGLMDYLTSLFLLCHYVIDTYVFALLQMFGSLVDKKERRKILQTRSYPSFCFSCGFKSPLSAVPDFVGRSSASLDSFTS